MPENRCYLGKLNYIKSLDGVRGLAILLVLMSHAQLFHAGWVGVDLFFVLSGYLITNILLREKDKKIPLKTKFRNFWARRVLRIFPLYYLYLIFLIVFWWLSCNWQEHSPRLPWLFTYTFNYFGLVQHRYPHYMTGHLWSLSVEEQFYLIFPFIVLLSNRRQLKILTVLLILFAIAFRLLAGMYLHASGLPDQRVGAIIYSSTVGHLDAFLLGGSLIVFDLSKIPRRIITLLLPALFLLTVFAGLLIYLRIKPGPFEFNDYITQLGYNPDYIQMAHHVWSYFIIDLLFAMVILIIMLYPKSFWGIGLNKIFSLDPLVAIGKVSYGMYIVHMAVKHLLLPAARQSGVFNKYIFFIIYLALVYGLARIIYQLYEKRFLRMKEKFR